MFTIGDFATFTQVSVPALRLWDRRGLLVPARVDPATGYRYYRADQVAVVQRIVAYKQLGFTLAQIGPLLATPPANDELAGMLALRRAEAEAERREAEDRIRVIEATLRLLDRSNAMPYDVIRKQSPAVRLAALTERLAPDDDAPARLFEVFGRLFGRLAGELGAAGVTPIGPPWSLYDRSDEHGIVLHAAMPVAPDADVPAGIEVIERPATEVASTVHLGDVAAMGAAYEAVMQWLETHGEQPAGGSAEISLVWDEQHPDRNVTELLVAIAPAT